MFKIYVYDNTCRGSQDKLGECKYSIDVVAIMRKHKECRFTVKYHGSTIFQDTISQYPNDFALADLLDQNAIRLSRQGIRNDTR